MWDCAFCLSCVEICPQSVRLTDIFTLLKNEVTLQNEAPSGYIMEAKSVYKYGSAMPLQPVIKRRREKLNLPPIKEFDIREIQDLINTIGINEIVGNSKTDNIREEF
jgi:heterodisulfide reductase subunit C